MRRNLLLVGAGIFLTPLYPAAAAGPPRPDESSSGLYTGIENGPSLASLAPYSRTGVFGGAVGYEFENGVRAEVESLHAEAPLPDAGSAQLGARPASASAVMLNGLYTVHNGVWEVKSFIGAGVGILDAGQRLLGAVQNDWVGYQLRGGVALGFSQKLIGNFEYRWTQGEKPHFGIAGLPAKIDIKRDGFHIGLDYHLH